MVAAPRFVHRPTSLALALAALLVAAPLSGSGCSFMFVEPAPPAHARMPYFDCTSSRLAPTTDLTLAALMGLATIGASSDSQQNTSDTSFLITTALVTGALVASGFRGLQQTKECREAKTELAERLMLRQDANTRPRTPRVDAWQSEGPAPAPAPAVAPEPAPEGAPATPIPAAPPGDKP